jgi:hypothetical protein
VAKAWNIELRGGCYDGWTGTAPQDPQPVIIAWVCGADCDGHMTFDVEDPGIAYDHAVAYCLSEVQTDEQLAIYDVGDIDGSPELEHEERELLPAGAAR